jgi:polyferredoxin
MATLAKHDVLQALATVAPRGTALVWALGLCSLGAAVALPFLPLSARPFWTTPYVLFLGALLAVPALLPLRAAWRLRPAVLLASLALFGFLQLACPRPTGALELLVLGLVRRSPAIAHALKLGVLLGLTLVFGRYFCAFICPNGALQELLFRPRLRITVPPLLDRVLRLGKHVAALALLLAPLLWGYRLVSGVEPFKVVFNLKGHPALVGFLGLVLVGSIFVSRPFCRWLCPIAAVLGLAARVSLVRPRLAATRCNGCMACRRVCPVEAIQLDRTPAGSVARVQAGECISCTECVAACPRGALSLGARAPRPAPARLTLVPAACAADRREASEAAPSLNQGASHV